MLGFDYGGKRIGVAIGSSAMLGARPLATVANRPTGPDWLAIDKLIATWQPSAAVVGEPLHEEGKPHPLAKAMRAFCRDLTQRYGLQVHRMHEGYSSREARSQLVEARARGERGKVVRGTVDPVAAALILQGFLELSLKARADAT